MSFKVLKVVKKEKLAKEIINELKRMLYIKESEHTWYLEKAIIDLINKHNSID